MPKYNIRFADFATRAALFELQVEKDTTVGALKAVAEEHLWNSNDLCPMKYFDKWYLEVRVGDRKKLVGIDEGDGGIALAAAGLEDESVVYLEGPMFGEGQAEVGRAIAAVRAQANANAAQHALQVQVLMAEMGRRFDSMAAKQKVLSEALEKAFRKQFKATKEEFEALDTTLMKQADTALEIANSAAQQSEVLDKKFEAMAAKHQEQSEAIDNALKQIEKLDTTVKKQSDANDKKLDAYAAKQQARDIAWRQELLLRLNGSQGNPNPQRAAHVATELTADQLKKESEESGNKARELKRWLEDDKLLTLRIPPQQSRNVELKLGSEQTWTPWVPLGIPARRPEY